VKKARNLVLDDAMLFSVFSSSGYAMKKNFLNLYAILTDATAKKKHEGTGHDVVSVWPNL
jgi:hypothetical protein